MAVAARGGRIGAVQTLLQSAAQSIFVTYRLLDGVRRRNGYEDSVFEGSLQIETLCLIDPLPRVAFDRASIQVFRRASAAMADTSQFDGLGEDADAETSGFFAR